MNTDAIARICEAVSSESLDQATAIARTELPFEALKRTKRAYTDTESVLIFLRDGFIDRYSGHRLVFPGTLRLLSLLMPAEIPFHPHGKMTECHLIFWNLFPTVDHVEAVARGGPDEETNWVCTSMLRNSAKAHWTLEELGWKLQPVGLLDDWDGMLGWFMKYVSDEPSILDEPYIKRWHQAARRALVE